MGGSALAFPAIVLTTQSGDFWLSIVGLAAKVFVSTSWYSPTLTMMQNTTKETNQGQINSAYNFYTTLASTVSPLIFSRIATELDVANNPNLYGTIITGFCVIGYLGSVPFFYKAGREYEKIMI